MADLVLDFTYTAEGLKVTFKNHSIEVPGEGTVTEPTFSWDFGDGSEPSQEKDPTHIYTEIGIYPVTLSSGSSNKLTREIALTDKVCTTLPGSIYDLISEYIPLEIFGVMPYSKRQIYIQKWQYYLGPLVNHCIEIEHYTNELYYEALENQLVMELAAYDWLTVKVSDMIQANTQHLIDSSASSSSSSTSTTTGGSTDIKRIITGPTEVEYFDTREVDKETASTVAKSIQPGGIIDALKEKICMLAERLQIYLPICRDRDYPKVPPRVVDRRYTGGLRGPNPKTIVKKGF